MARYRLGRHSFTSSLNPELMGKLNQAAENKLWPSLVDEAKAVVEAIDALGRDPNGRAAVPVPRPSAPRNDIAGHALDLTPLSKIGDVSVEQSPGDASDANSPPRASSPPSADPASEGLRSAFAALAALATTGAPDSPRKK